MGEVDLRVANVIIIELLQHTLLQQSLVQLPSFNAEGCFQNRNRETTRGCDIKFV